MGLFAWIGKGCAWLFKLVALPLTKLGSPAVRPFVRWVLHAGFVLISLICLAYLDVAFEFDKVVRAPLPALRVLWLPILFLLVYGLAWLAWWTWKVATSAGDPSRFPDLDEAWQEGLRALEQAQIDLLETPLYLVVGGATSGENELFQSAGIEYDVPLTPRRSDAPLRLCATRDAVFVSLARASTSGLFTAKLAQRHQQKRASADSTSLSSGSIVAATGASAGNVATATAVMLPKTAQRGLELIEQSLAMLQDEHEKEAISASEGDTLGLTDVELESTTQRLEHICHLLADSRVPYCPINGLVTLIPWHVTDSSHIANHAAVLLDHDIQTIERELRINAPRLAIVTDVQSAPGGTELVERIPADQRSRRFGIRYPQLASCDLAKWPEIAEEGVQWLCQQLAPSLIYRVFSLSNDGSDRDLSSWEGNVQLYEFMFAIRRRTEKLTRIVQRGILPSTSKNVVLNGLYLAATGGERTTSQAFLPGVLPQLLEMQNSVTWNADALRADARCRRWTVGGYAVLALFVVGMITAAIYAS